MVLVLGLTVCNQVSEEGFKLSNESSVSTGASTADNETKEEAKSTVKFSVEDEATEQDLDEIAALLGKRFNNSYLDLQYNIIKDAGTKTIQFMFVKPEGMTDEFLRAMIRPDHVQIIKGKSSEGNVIAENDNIMEAYGKLDSESSVKSWYVYYKLDSVGTKNLADATQELLGTDVSVTVMIDDEQIISGLVQTPVTDGESFVTGEITENEAKDIGARMAGGYLKFNLSVTEESAEK